MISENENLEQHCYLSKSGALTPQAIILCSNHVKSGNQLMQEYFPTSLNVITN